VEAYAQAFGAILGTPPSVALAFLHPRRIAVVDLEGGEVRLADL
jgi:hypothetical protein